MAGSGDDGWGGYDLRVRQLRVVATAVLLVLISAVVLDIIFDPSEGDTVALIQLVGALVVTLGFTNRRGPR